MSINLIVSNIVTFELFCKSPKKYLCLGNESGIVEIKKNKPIMYVVSASLLNKLVSITYKEYFSESVRESKKILVDFKKKKNLPVFTVEKKFKMYDEWVPDDDFIKKSLIWGINLITPVTESELSFFISYWKVEGRYFYHIQWQQKLAQSLDYSRNKSFLLGKKETSMFEKESYLNNEVPIGFREK
ncbi:Primosomal protein 1 [Buchnera aphidicola (Anoecia corni)]|uniref:Primosomal protein 1 n=1 Tax=Buchnera aphidicola (Anoecia corni) TaxID=2994477 RepID=A0AAT9IFR4_9GAMM